MKKIITVFVIFLLVGCASIKEQHPGLSWLTKSQTEDLLSGKRFKTKRTISFFHINGDIEMCMDSGRCYNGYWKVNEEGRLAGYFPEFDFFGYFSANGDYYPTDGRKQVWKVIRQTEQ